MSNDELLCLSCEVPMEVGFLLDRTHAALMQARWCEGVPKPSFFGGELSSKQAKEGLRVTTYRCPSCGRLESFALPEPERNDQ